MGVRWRRRSDRRLIRLMLLGGVLVAGMLPASPVTAEDGLARAGESRVRGDAARGHALFNGKGACSYCHGVDGHLSQRPALSEDTRSIVAGLSPPPPDLRIAGGLRETTDAQRFHTIRDGHSGTGMLPDPSLTDQDIRDLLAYLSVLRGETGPDTGSGR